MQFAVELAELTRLDTTSSVPLYAQLADMLAKRIREAHADLAGRALPSEIETAAHFNISRPTVRQAMGQLLSEGLIVRGRGRGTFVAPPHARRHLGRAFEFDLLPANHAIEFRLLNRERIIPEKTIQDLFKLGEEDEIERITRLRLVDGECFGFEVRYLPVRFSPQVTNAILSQEAGVQFARRLIDDTSGRVHFRIRSIPADAENARVLGMKRGAPLLSSEHTYFAADETPILHGTVLFRGDRYDFSFMAPVHGIASTDRRMHK